MFKEISILLTTYLSSLPDFTAVMRRNDNGAQKLFLFPIVASIENTLPLTTYILDEKTAQSKDLMQLGITLNFWFDVENYDQCCEFTDKMGDLIDDKYIFKSSSIDYNDESGTFSGSINFSLT